MAGRPVAVSSGQSSGMMYGLIAFAIVSLLTTGWAIFQLTQVSSLQNQAQDAQRRADHFGRPPAYYDDEARSRRTTVSKVMSDDIRDVAQLVTGVPDDVGASIKTKSQRLLDEIEQESPGTINKGDTLLTALSKLHEQYKSESGASEAMQIVVDDLTGEIESLTAQLKSTRDEFESQVESISNELRQVQEDKSETLRQKDEQLAELQRTLDAREQELQRLKREGTDREREYVIEIGRLEGLIERLQLQIQELKPGALDPRAILTKADGRILRAIPGSDVVYINLGAGDEIKPGMGFEVYSQSREASDSLRGKASVEVVTVMEETAECRITRREPGEPIIEGDIVVNIAFERQRKPKFVIRGDFDLDYDGIIDQGGGIQQVASMIRRWGGQVVDELDETVDYVVIGVPPDVPQFDADRASDIVRDQAQRQALERGRFGALVQRAQKMYIPVITQNQFLFLLGYAGNG